ncbi:MAG: SpoIIE family protein phosphatase [Phycisphaerales bacterium]|nr:SpoIIE family protein phosphatase [Phycisphaerales bacterium]
MSLRLKLVLLVVLPLMIIFTALVLLQYQSMRDTAIEAAKDHALLLTQATARDIEGQLAKVVHVTHTGAAALEAAPELSNDRVWPLLEQLVERVPLVDGASVAAAARDLGADSAAPYVWMKDGVLHREDLVESYDYTTHTWYTIAAAGTAGWTKPYDGPVFGGILVSYSVPVIRQDVLAAVLSVDVPLAPLQELLTVGEFKEVMAYLVGPDDRFISHPDETKIMEPSTDGGGPRLLAEAESGTLKRFADWPNDQPHIVAFEPIPTADWMFAAAMSEDEVLGPVHRQLTMNVGLLLLGGVLIAGLVLGMGLRITGDVRKLGKAVAKVSAGDLEAKVEHMRRRDELGTLVLDFNAMTTRLRETVQHVADEQVARQAIEQELDVAREIQEQMLPHESPMLPDHPEIDLHAINVAARHVAGDFFDYWIRGDTLTIVLADVSGSGMPAALVMVRAMTLLRQFDDPDRSLPTVVSKTNEVLCGSNERQLFVTGIIIRFDVMTGAYHLVSAGHLPALLGDGAGKVREEGDSTGPLLGVIPGACWDERAGMLSAGGWMGLYTDGITEARDSDGEMLEVAGLKAGLSGLHDASAEVLCRQGVRLAKRWHGGRVDDDLSMMVLRYARSAS